MSSSNFYWLIFICATKYIYYQMMQSSNHNLYYQQQENQNNQKLEKKTSIDKLTVTVKTKQIAVKKMKKQDLYNDLKLIKVHPVESTVGTNSQANQNNELEEVVLKQRSQMYPKRQKRKQRMKNIREEIEKIQQQQQKIENISPPSSTGRVLLETKTESPRKLKRRGNKKSKQKIEMKPLRKYGEILQENYEQKQEQKTVNKIREDTSDSQDQMSQDQIQVEEQANVKIIQAKKLINILTFIIPKTNMIRCVLKVVKNDLLSFESVFQLYLLEQKRLIMRAKKRKFSISSQFEILSIEKKKQVQYGLVRSNYSRTQYKLLRFVEDNNKKQNESEVILSEENQQRVQEREQLFLSYGSNFLGFSQQNITIMKPVEKIKRTEKFSDIRTAYQNHQFKKVNLYSNKMAEKNIQGELVLDFKGQSLVDSNKNMIIENDAGDTSVIFGKKEEGYYILNVYYPFCLFEGFFLGLCNLDKKLFVS